jgi:hypothetical protein
MTPKFRIEDLLLHLARRHVATQLNEPVGERRFSVVNVGDNGEVAYERGIGHGRVLSTSPSRAKGPFFGLQTTKRRA